jgi:UDP-N-acetylglucosamine--N-acetylmuramyl-(pentapeptide) pyrophosphoryl-undecaprenol N-acetylglucosamine transferase
MRVAIAAGGTGGHVYPAVAVARGLIGRKVELHWFGRPSSLEEREAAELKIPFNPIPLQGLKRKLSLKVFHPIYQYWCGKYVARKGLLAAGTEVLFALGSYVSAPVISAALSLKIPVLIHEQNVVPGLVVRYFSRKVNQVLLTRPLVRSLSLFPAINGWLIPHRNEARTSVVGMPIRAGIVMARTDEIYTELGLDPSKRTLLIFGGSQGARSLCQLGIDICKKWQQDHLDWQILLQTGERNYSWVSESIASLAGDPTNESRKPFRHQALVIIPHIKEMGKAYACADVIVARSGAVSCSEIEAVAKPVIFVPYPYATNDHQTLNAQEFTKLRQGVVISEQELSISRIEQAIQTMLANQTPHSSSTTNDTLDHNPVDQIIELIFETYLSSGRHKRVNDGGIE